MTWVGSWWMIFSLNLSTHMLTSRGREPNRHLSDTLGKLSGNRAAREAALGELAMQEEDLLLREGALERHPPIVVASRIGHPHERTP